MIEARSLTRTFVRADGQIVTALADLNVSIAPGEFTCVIGPSGHGKSTLLHLAAGLLEPSRGEILVGGKPVRGPGPDRGMVFQRDSVFPWKRVLANVEYGLKCRGVPERERRETARRFLAEVGLEGVEKSWPRELSGGMLKRVAVATVFANDSEVLLLDEPFGPLDYVTRRQLQALLLKLWAQSQTASGSRRTVLFVTHDVDEAITLADRILVIKQGRLIEDLRVSLPRPRTDDDLALPEALAAKHILLRHLGLERADPTATDPSTTRSLEAS